MLGKNVQAKEVNLNGNDSISVAGESYLLYLYMCLHCLQFVRILSDFARNKIKVDVGCVHMINV